MRLIRSENKYLAVYPIVVGLFAVSSLLIPVSCSVLKLDKESNCLNDKAACFKADKTAPQLDKAILPLPYQPGNNTISTLASVDLMFSEELNNPKPSDFVFSGPGAVNGITVNAIEKIGSFQYRLHVTASLDTGDIFLDFPNLKDYNGNKISGPTQVHYYGNVDITVPIVSVSHYGVGTGGYPSIAVSWRHNYTPVLAGNTLYTIGLTTGSSDCNGATMVTPVTPDIAADTPLGSGAHVSPFDAANPVTTTHSFTLNTSVITSLGAQVILICVKNASNNKRGSAAISVVRDDSAPVTTIAPLEGPYATAKSVTFDCNDNADRVIYNVGYTSGTGVDPSAAAISDPTFNASTGAITNGTEYNSALKPTTPYFANPTHSIFKYRCIDRAGNIEAVKTSQVYIIDSNLPEVTISKIYKSGTTREITGLSSQAGAYQSADIVWSTNQVNKPWTLRHGSTNCTNGSVVTSGVTPLSGTTPLTANQTVPMPAALVFDSTGISAGVNTLRLCVQNGALYGQDVLTIIRDDIAPTVVPNVAGGNYGATQSLQFVCSDNADVVAFSVGSADGAGTVAPPPPLPAFDSDGVLVAGSGSPQTAPTTTPNQKTSVYNWRCIDKSGNKSASVGTATYVIDSMVPTITIVSNTYSVLGANAPQNTTALAWKSSYASRNYEVRVGGADCSTGTLIAGPALTPADTNTAVVTNIGQASLVEGANTVRICVENYTGLSGMKGFATQTLTKDTTAPTIPNQAATIAAVDATNFTLTIPAASDVGSGIAGYRVYRTDTISYPTFPVLPTYTITTSPATIQMPTTAKYYLKVVPFDGAGNVPTSAPLAYSELTTKPTITLVVTGLDTANSKTFNLTDGAASTAISINTLGAPWTTTLGTGSTYSFSVSTQPVGQVCSIKEKQFGTLSSDLTININCVNGQIVAGGYRALQPAGLNYMLYRTRASVKASATDPNSITVVGGNMYYGDYADCNGVTAGTPYCIYRLPVTTGAATVVVNNLPAAVRGIANDGTNLYFVTIAPDNKLYKYPLSGGTPVEIASGLSNPFGLVIDSDFAYICNRGSNEILRVPLLTGGAATTIVSGLSAGPIGLALSATHLYFTTWGEHAVYRVPKAGGAVVAAYGSTSTPGLLDETGTGARFNQPHDLAYDGTDNIFVADMQNHRVRKIRLSTGRVISLAGDGTSAFYTGGTGSGAKLPSPVGIATDGASLYLSTHLDDRVIKLSDGGLVGHWPLTSQTALADYNSDHTAVNNSSWVSGTASFGGDRFGGSNALLFNGLNTQLSAASALTSGSVCNVSMSAWFRATTPATGSSQVIVYNGNSGNSGFGLMLTATGEVALLFGGVGSIGSHYIAQANQWTHATVLCKATNRWEIYINGHLMYFGDGSASQRPNANAVGSLFIGKGAGGATEHLSGAISDVRMYSRPLSEGEINELAQDANSSLVGSTYNTGATELLAHYESANNASSGAFADNLLGGATSATGKDGEASGAYVFDGSSSLSVTTTALAALPLKNAPRTMCAFVNPTAYPANGNFTSPVSYGSSGGLHEFGLALSTDGSGNAFVANTFNSGVDHVIAHRLPLRTWSHFCATYDGSNARLYINGQLLGTKTVAIDTLVTGGALRLGAWFDDLHRFQGVIDDTRIYNKALTAAEIRQLSVQVPSGLVARYDLDADTNDVSGFGNHMTNSGATQTDDRFGMNSTAHKFNGSGNTMAAGAVTQATSSVTFALWVKPAATPAAFTGIFDNYNGTSGAGGSGGGFIINGSGQLSFFSRGGVDQDCPTTYTLPVDVYTHLAATQSVSPANISIYVNGSLVSSCAPSATPSIFNNSQPLRLGKSVWANTFNGNIDDARLYNRTLTQAEVQALVQQPNKRIYVTNNTYDGNLGGIAGADAKCNAADTNKPPGAGTFKALLVDSGASLLRRACTTGNCATGGVGENIDWVLRPNITYLRGQDSLPVFTANFNGVFDFGVGSFTNPIHSSAFSVWTGINFGVGGQWTIDGGPGQCTTVASAGWINSFLGGSNGVYGDSGSVSQTVSATPVGVFYNGFEPASCLTLRRLYCVEQ